MFNIPLPVLALIGVLTAVHLIRLALPFERDLWLLAEFGVVPARFALEFGWLDQERIVRDLTAGLGGQAAMERLAVAQYFVDGAGPRWWSLLTYAGLHANTPHILTNLLWLAVFGSPLARRLETPRFLALLAAGAVAGALMHLWANPADVAPLVGASAAISAATGAAARFVFSIGLRMDMMGDPTRVRLLPALTLVQLVQNRAALAFILIWFATNWLFGAGVVTFGGMEESIAWQAHVGGFLAGLLLFPLVDRPGR
jgi:membrane associated rhomboid family serine protease